MPIIEQNPAWSGILSGLITAYGMSQGMKNAKQEKQRQQQIDAQNAALNAAQVKLYGTEAQRNTEQSALDKANIGKDTAYNRAHGFDANGNPIPINTKGIELQPGNKGKKSPVTAQQRFDAAKQAYERGASMGITGPANPYFQPMQDAYNLLMRQEQEQTQAQLLGLRYAYQKQLKGVPTYGNLHHVGRGGGSGGGVDTDTYNYAEETISKSPNPLATAAHLAAIATEHGAKKPTIDAIRDLGTYYSGKHNVNIRTSGGSPFGNAPQ